MRNRRTFRRFKYAEEAAHGLDDDGRKWVMYRGEDEEDEEDGYTYTRRVYVVEWD